MKLHKRKIDILNGNIFQQIMLFLYPVLISYIIQQIYGVWDCIVLGRYVSDNALAAYGGSATTLINISINFISGICAGVTILTAQNYGKGNFERVKKVIESGVFVALVIGGILTVIGCGFAPGLLRILSTPEETINESIIYMVSNYSTMIPYFIYNVGISVLRGAGDSKKPLYFTILICICRLVLDSLLCIVFKMGILGIGIAVIASNILCCVVMLIIFQNTLEHYQFSLKDFSFDKEIVSEIIKVGLPAAIQSMLFAFSSMFVLINVNKFGTNAVTAFSVYNNVDNYYWCFSNSLGAALITLVSQNYGNNNIKRVRKITLYGTVIHFIGSLLYFVIFHYFGESIIGIYTSSQGIIAISKQMLDVVARSYFAYTLVETLSCTLKGCGEVVISMNIVAICICGIRMLYLLFFPQTTAIHPIYCFPLSWTISSLVFLFYYCTNKKLKEKKNN